MAKNKVYIDVVVDDKGTTQRLEVSTKKLAKALDKAGISASSTDRRLKGAAQASSNTTKNFSKMAQGITGGLVPAYATLAATVFAVSAAFRFLQEAGDLQALQEGQIAYASATGVAMKSLTNSIIEATGAQIKFQDAAQAAAIGTAAGLSANQLERLGTAAKDVSLVLGRDVTDSFNRLVRGVTKAEPELLDELGIVLRLKDATERYAASLGKSANDLTQFEKSQAVANDVLTQAEEKFSKIVAVTEPQINQFNRLGKAFDDLVNTIKNFISKALGPVAGFIADNPFSSLIATLPIFGSLFNTVLKGAGVDLKEWANTAKAQGEAARKNIQKTIVGIQSDISNIKFIRGDTGAIEQFTAETQKSIKNLVKNLPLATRGMKTLQQEGIVGARTATLMIKQLDAGIGSFEGLSKKRSLLIRKELENILLVHKATATGAASIWTKASTTMQIGAKKVQQAWVTALSFIQVAAAKTAAAIQFAFTRILPVIATVAIAFELLPDKVQGAIKEFLGFQKELDSGLKESLSSLESLTSEFEKFVETQKILASEIDGIRYATLQNFGAVGNLLESVPINDLLIGLQAVSKAQEEFNTRQKTAIEQLRSGRSAYEDAVAGLVNPQISEENFRGFLEEKNLTAPIELIGIIRSSIEETGLQSTIAGKRVLEVTSNLKDLDGITLYNAIRAFTSVSAVAEQLPRLIKETDDIVSQSFLGATPSTQFSASISSINNAIEALNTVVKQVSKKDRTFDPQRKEIERLTSIRELLLKYDEESFVIEKEKLILTQKYSKSLLGATNNQKRLLGIRREISNLDILISEERLKQERLAELQKKATEGQKLEIARQLELSRLQTQEYRNQIELQKRQIDNTSRLVDSFNQSFESGLEAGLNEFISAKESSFKDAGLKLAEGILLGLSKTLSTLITEQIVGALGIGNNPVVANTVATESNTTAINTLVEKLTASVLNPQVTDSPSTIPELIRRPTDEIERGVSRTSGKEAGKETTNASRPLSQFFVGAKGKTSVEENGNKDDFLGKRAGGIFDPFINAITNIFNPESGWLSKLGGLFSAFPQSLQNLFSNIGQLFSGGFGGAGGAVGGIGGFISNLFGTGGIASGGFRAFATGGVATEPTLGLVGEGKHNEAIVPLPNGNSIPVELMNGSSTANNNVSININMSGGGADAQGTNDAITLFGNSIADMVQREIADQTRPGGLLARQ